MLNIRHSRGFSMIELMVGIVIMAVLVATGFPAFNTYMDNGRVRSAAENFMTGLQLARSEAVRRNGSVEFLLTADEARGANVETANLDATSASWMVRVLDPATGLHDFVEGKSWFQDSGQTSAATPRVTVAGTTSSIMFTGLGATTLGVQATFDFKNPTGGACAGDPTPGPIRCLRVVVAVGGQARMCDPAANAAGDTRKC